MIKIGDVIPCLPSVQATSKNILNKAKVVYIHPLGRYYVVQFDCGRAGKFCESREFSISEMEEAYRLGVFARPVVEVIFDPSQKRREQQSMQWRKKHRPVEDPTYEDFDDDISTIMAMA